MSLAGMWRLAREHPAYLWREYTGVRLRARWLTDDAFGRAFYDDVFAPELALGSTVLDVGCGWGRFTRTLARLGCRVWGLDISDRQWRYWRQIGAAEPRSRFLLGDAQALPFRRHSVDAAICSGVLHEVPEPRRVLEEIVRVVRPGGTLFVAAPNDRRLWNGDGGVVGAALAQLGCRVTRTWGEGLRVPVLTPLATMLTPYAPTISFRSRRVGRLSPPERWLHRVVVARTGT